jgi:mono/diheme cytochrome c family protein
MRICAARGLLLAAAVSVSGCASESDNRAAAARGEAVAQQACGACHGMGQTDASTFPGAPAFRDMRFDYNAIMYERSLSKWPLGRTGMPPAGLSLGDLADVGAYIFVALRGPDSADRIACKDSKLTPRTAAFDGRQRHAGLSLKSIADERKSACPHLIFRRRHSSERRGLSKGD